jgi:hypothetical protein
MPEQLKQPPRKRIVTGWRQVERRRAEVRAKHRPPVVVLPKREV